MRQIRSGTRIVGGIGAAALLVLLFGCDGGVNPQGETQPAGSAEDLEQQTVGESSSTYGKARDRAEDVVEQLEQRQDDLMDSIESSGDGTPDG